MLAFWVVHKKKQKGCQLLCCFLVHAGKRGESSYEEAQQRCVPLRLSQSHTLHAGVCVCVFMFVCFGVYYCLGERHSVSRSTFVPHCAVLHCRQVYTDQQGFSRFQAILIVMQGTSHLTAHTFETLPSSICVSARVSSSPLPVLVRALEGEELAPPVLDPADPAAAACCRCCCCQSSWM